MYPPFLKPNDKIVIVSPSGCIDSCFIDGAVERLSDWGYRPVVSNYARGKVGRFSGLTEERISDLQEALDDREAKAILCSRGGYGLSQIIDSLDFTNFEINPKWIIGFSDITVLHNVATALDVVSIHSIMTKHLTELQKKDEAVELLHQILKGDFPIYSISANPLNRKGEAQGKIVGGNLSVIYSMRGTHFDLDAYHKILFIEDVGEKPYHIDRMMQNLRIGGVLENLEGLIVGQFSDYEEDLLMGKTVYEIIADAVSDYDFPVCFDFPAGHVDRNLPLLMNGDVSFSVNNKDVELSFSC